MSNNKLTMESLEDLVLEMLKESANLDVLSRIVGKKISNSEDFTDAEAAKLKNYSFKDREKPQTLQALRRLLNLSLKDAKSVIQTGKLSTPGSKPPPPPEKEKEKSEPPKKEKEKKVKLDPPKKEKEKKKPDPVKSSGPVFGKTNPPLEQGVEFKDTTLKEPKQADDDFKKLLKALQDALKDAGITKDELKYVAGLFESRALNEEKTELELDDIMKLFDIGESNPEDLHRPFKKKGKGDIFSVGQKIQKTLQGYINKAIKLGMPRDKIRSLIKVNREFPKMLARNQGYNPETGASGLRSFEIPRSAQADVPTAGSRAKIDPRLIQTFNNFFGGVDSFPARVSLLSDFSDKFVSGDSDISLKDFANGAPILKLMSNITRQFNATSAGTEMEATLALIVAGGKIGGSNGAGDFIDAKGNEFSAKWVQASSGIEQASLAKALQAVPGKSYSITYVIGVKLGTSATPVADISGNLMKTTQVAIYLVKFVYKPKTNLKYTKSSEPDEEGEKAKLFARGQFSDETEIKNALNDVNAYKENKNLIWATLKAYNVGPNGEQGRNIGTLNMTMGKHLKDKRGLKISLDKTWPKLVLGTDTGKAEDIVAKIGQPTAIVKFVDAEANTIVDQYENYITNAASEAQKYMSNINQQLEIIAESTLDFANDTSFASAYSINDGYVQLKEDMKGLFDSVDTTGAISKSVGLAENKKQNKSKKDLDKLIKEVILKRLLK